MRLWVKPDQLAKLASPSGNRQRHPAQKHREPRRPGWQRTRPKGQESTIPSVPAAACLQPKSFGEIVVRETPIGGIVACKESPVSNWARKITAFSAASTENPAPSLLPISCRFERSSSAQGLKKLMAEAKTRFPGDLTTHFARYHASRHARHQEIIITLGIAIILSHHRRLHSSCKGWRATLIPLLAGARFIGPAHSSSSRNALRDGLRGIERSDVVNIAGEARFGFGH